MTSSISQGSICRLIHRRHALGLLAAAGLLPSRSFADVAPQRSEIREDLAKHFRDAGTVGTFVGYKVDDYLDHRQRQEPLGRGEAAGLDLQDPELADRAGNRRGRRSRQGRLQVGRGHAQHRGLEPRPHPALAIAASAVPVYQEIARRIGAERMQKYVDLFDYGNRDIGGGIDQFWLTGSLRIDPVQQVDFVDRLRRGVLPVSKRSQDLVRDILPVTKVGDAIDPRQERTARRRSGKPSLGWMVGWAEKGSEKHGVRAQPRLSSSRAISPIA